MFNFYEMIRRVAAGGQCRRQTWGDEAHHVCMYPLDGAEDRLALYKPEVGAAGTYFPWTVSRSDIEATDWRVVEKKTASLKIAASPVPGKPTVQ